MVSRQHLAEPLLAGEQPAVEVQADQQRVVVEHLLEVRHQPHAVDGVAGEAAAEVVVDAAGGHGVERDGERAAGPARSPAAGGDGQRLLRHRLRELRRAAEAAPLRIGGAARAGGTRRRRRRRWGGRRRGTTSAERPSAPVSWSACCEEVVALGVPELVDPLAQLDEADHPAAALLREVRAGEERATVGRAHHRHRPAALAGHGLGGLHVDVVDVGSLLAVDLHVHEVPVHDRGDVGVLEALVGHHVAPVARRVADRQQDRHVALGRRGEGLVAPRVPVDRVVGVLPQVRAGLVGESVHPITLGVRRGGTVRPWRSRWRGRSRSSRVRHGASAGRSRRPTPTPARRCCCRRGSCPTSRRRPRRSAATST